jgi:hypothetical protein
MITSDPLHRMWTYCIKFAKFSITCAENMHMTKFSFHKYKIFKWVGWGREAGLDLPCMHIIHG